ncbi:unnamed protein product [Somion occarium]
MRDTPSQREDDQSTSSHSGTEKADADIIENGEKATRKGLRSPKYDASLVKALHRTFFWRWWGAGALKLFSDTLKTTTPLLNKVLLTWLTNSYIYYRASEDERAAGNLEKPQGVGYGIGLAFALFVMQESASLMTNHFMQMTMTTGLSIRTAIIGTIFRKSLRLSGKARLDHSVGQITTMISADATRLDRSSYNIHNLWVAPIQIAIGIGLLIGNLGYSALVGLGVLIFAFPIQLVLVRTMFRQRKKGVKITDSRVRLTTEVLQGIRLIKFYAWESFYTNQIGSLRAKELKTIRKMAFARSLILSCMIALPVFASVLSFITYGLSGHELNIATIFTSLQFFNIIRAPLAFFPVVIASASDAVVALGRISKFLMAEEIAEPYTIEPNSKFAVDVDADFRWETAYKAASGGPKFARGKAAAAKTTQKNVQAKNAEKPQSSGKRSWFSKRKNNENVLPTTSIEESKQEEIEEKDEDKPFALHGLKLQIPKGSFVAIVGRVGSGKSSLLQALIGEMRRTRGEAHFSSSVAYVPQTSWIMNATLRENILFGRDDDEERLQEIIRACCLEHDLEMLPHGEDTEIGEKGINLSGGQKARVSLARAAYSDADIVLMDDSLSAVDAYVGKQILENCLLNGPLADKTRVMATHALHVLDKTDYIYVMDNGAIVEQGTFQDLMDDNGMFARLMDEYGSLEKEKAGSEDVKERKGKALSGALEPKDAKKAQAALMQQEERMTGSVAGMVYVKYFRYAGGVLLLPWLLLLLTAYQGSMVANNLFLGFWTSESIHGFSQGDYMATYGGLGAGVAVFSFLLSFSISVVTLSAGLSMFKTALLSVLRSPISFFDTTPMGRIMSRLSKDQDTLDSEIAMTAFQLLSNVSSVIGTIALVFYTFPYLGILFAPLGIFYTMAAVYYRRTSVETKRLDSLMRSALYASYSETLTGLSTVRGYGEQSRFIHKAEEGLDMENRAYYMTISIQRWLSVRLDLLGNLLILGIALFSAGFRKTVSPSKIGVVLSYTLSITQFFSELVSSYAQNEQNFNAVERVLYYTDLPSEGDATTPNDPPPLWPDQGAVEFKDVELTYRDGLPLVLRGVTFSVKPGEKVGIVGRTGAGKSSLLQALFRIVNVQGGTVIIDGHNIRDVGLDTLRSRLALVPQDSTLFMGTLRENLDPQGTRTDAELISALKRAWLLPRDGSPVDPIVEAKFSLDASVSDEGSNYSAGEKQLLALCRALVKNSKIIVLDEATSNVDVETDAKLQRTIQSEFASSTLLCIAHRLNTIVYYDRIIVMDAGKVVEHDTPLNLFDKEDSIFRSLCNEAGLTRQDILRIRASAQSTSTTVGGSKA